MEIARCFMAEVEFNDVIENMEKLFSQQLTELDKLHRQNDVIVWKSDSQAAAETGLGRTYFSRIRYRLPHIEIEDAATGVKSTVYPKAAVKKWLADHIEYYQ